jgi:tetratricopeptide (TPR) repeat protein
MTRTNTPNSTALAASAKTASQHLKAGRIAEAEAMYRQLLAAEPEHHEALFNMATILCQQKKYDEAIACCRKVIDKTPDMVMAHNNLGNIYFEQKDLVNALASYRHALELGGRNVELYNNVGNVLKEQGEFDEALANYNKALKLQPRSAAVISNIGEIYRSLNRFDDAIAQYRKALAIESKFAQAQWNLSMSLFTLGDYKAGFPWYEKRFDADRKDEFAALAAMAQQFSAKPRWQGENLQDKTLLIWAEQGLGDSVMMMRYLSLLREKGAGAVVVYCERELVKLMLTKTSLVIDNQTPVRAELFDVHCPMMSLPYAFGTTLETIPQRVPYLQVPAAMTEKWSKQLSKFNGLKVGLAWAGNQDMKKDHLRSIALERLAPLMALPGVQFVSLQKGEASRQLKDTNWRVLDWMDACEDLMDTAALIESLDVVISVDSVVAHLAGALGKPVWLLNRFESEWRWMMERVDSPWYPRMRIFRQAARHDWDGVIEAVKVELGKLLPAGTGGAAAMQEPDWRKQAAKADQALNIGEKTGFFGKLFARKA